MENTTCYQCETEIQAPSGSVHPLCDECQDEFEGWFNSQLVAFK